MHGIAAAQQIFVNDCWLLSFTRTCSRRYWLSFDTKVYSKLSPLIQERIIMKELHAHNSTHCIRFVMLSSAYHSV